MADYRAIASVCEAVKLLLRSNFKPEIYDFFSNHKLVFEVFTRDHFDNGMEAGVSVFLYRIFHNGTHRIPTGTVGPSGERLGTKLPLDMHFLLTAWAKDASLQNAIAGWMMRVIEDNPILQPGLLNHKWKMVFAPDETVEISLAKLSTEDVFRIWDTLIQNKYQLSVPYLARNVWIESQIELPEKTPVLDRELRFHRPVQPDSD